MNQGIDHQRTHSDPYLLTTFVEGSPKRSST